jgi:hypothetical protein
MDQQARQGAFGRYVNGAEARPCRTSPCGLIAYVRKMRPLFADT